MILFIYLLCFVQGHLLIISSYFSTLIYPYIHCTFHKVTLGNPEQKNGGFHPSKIQTNYNGWPHGCPGLHSYIDVGIYPGYPFFEP